MRCSDLQLYLIEILHQTTTSTRGIKTMSSCILSKFYIKPQLSAFRVHHVRVVSYRNSTSNHNSRPIRCRSRCVVSYRNSTSNHNLFTINCQRFSVVSYRNSTSNHNTGYEVLNVGGVVSYRNSTSNHNKPVSRAYTKGLYLIEILHQTTTLGLILIDKVLLTGCLPL